MRGEELIVERSAEAHLEPDATALTAIPTLSGPSDTQPSRVTDLRSLPLRSILVTIAVLALVWLLFVAETAADNDVLGGLGVLLTGFGSLPALLSDTSGYSAWWSWASESEGFAAIGVNVLEHVQLVAASMALATVVSVVLGVLIHRVRSLRGPVLAVASVFLTIPSLALFAVFISVPGIGIGDRGPIIALTMYSVLPILRNTITGLEDVDRAVIESARGMGMSAAQRFARIELPLAWPVILTGIRVATLLNIGIAAIAPLVGGTGLGGYIRDGLQRFPDVTSVERMWTGVIFTLVLALIADGLIALVRRLTTSRGLRT